MKIKLSISVKFALLSALLLILLVFTLTYVNIRDQEEYFENVKLKEQMEIYPQALDLKFGNMSFLKDRNLTAKSVDTFIKNNQDKVLSFNIILPAYNSTGNDNSLTLRIFESNDDEKIGKIPKYKEENLYCLVEQPDRPYYTRLGDSYNYLLISAIPSDTDSESYIGTFELIISMETDFIGQQARLNNIINTSIFFLIAIVIALFSITYVIIQKPTTSLRKAANLLGKGDLNTRVDIRSKDELGELASTFNKMAGDLTKSRDKIEDYNRVLEKILDQKDEFIGQLGHDLKNPLQPLVGLLPILIEQEKDPNKKETLKVMNKNVEYMRELILETLKLAKLRSDDIKFNFEKLRLRDQAESAIESQRLSLEKNNIEAENKIDKNFYVKGDRLRLSEVFKNLIDNATKYSSNEGGKIVLNAEKEEDMIKISVKDNGIGMNKEQLSHIFDVFYKAEEKTEDVYSSGLGLSICKRIIEKHGGKIWAESSGPGKGSTFYFTLIMDHE